MLSNARFETRRLVLAIIIEKPITLLGIVNALLRSGDDCTREQVETALIELLDNEIIRRTDVSGLDKKIPMFHLPEHRCDPDQWVRNSVHNVARLRESFLSATCIACGNEKWRNHFVCRRCFNKLPWEARSCLWQICDYKYEERILHVHEYAELVAWSLDRLGAETPSWPRAALAGAA